MVVPHPPISTKQSKNCLVRITVGSSPAATAAILVAMPGVKYLDMTSSSTSLPWMPNSQSTEESSTKKKPLKNPTLPKENSHVLKRISNAREDSTSKMRMTAILMIATAQTTMMIGNMVESILLNTRLAPVENRVRCLPRKKRQSA